MFWQCKCTWRELSHREHCSRCGLPRPFQQHDPGPKLVKNTPAKNPPAKEDKPPDPGYTYF